MQYQSKKAPAMTSHANAGLAATCHVGMLLSNAQAPTLPMKKEFGA
jgi:hypothetical protein